MTFKLCAIVILYKPNYEEVFKNISSYINDVDKLYIVSNSKLDKDFLLKINKIKNIKLINNETNIGIAKALNVVLNISRVDGFSWLLTMDQDTFFKKNDFKKFLTYFSNIKKDFLILYSPLHNKKFLSSKEDTEKEKEFVMTSGNIVNIQSALKIGGFEENLFIDEVDHEFCFKATREGYKVLQNMNISVEHKLGEKINNRTLYPSLRIYYMVRNYLYLRKEYFNEHINFFKKRDLYLIRFFLRHILLSKERFSCIKMITLGMIDYKNKKFGKFNHE